MTQHYMSIRVHTAVIDSYPELYERYKEGLGDSLRHMFDAEPDWGTFRRYDGVDDPITPEELRPYSTLTVLSKEEEG